MNLRTTSLAAVLALLGGCSLTQPRQPEPAELTTPADFHISGSVDLDLTPQMSIESGLPASVRVTLNAAAHAEAVSATPLRSRQSGHLTLLATDGSGARKFVGIQLDVTGDQAGTPDEALVVLISRFADGASMMTRPVTATSRPAR